MVAGPGRGSNPRGKLTPDSVNGHVRFTLKMRIAYVANYQGPDLVKSRPCLHNFSLAGRVKIQLIADLLRRSSHEVEIISQGALEPLVGADKLRFRFYPRFSESERFHPDIPIDYVSALSVKFLIGLWESVQAARF